MQFDVYGNVISTVRCISEDVMDSCVGVVGLVEALKVKVEASLDSSPYILQGKATIAPQKPLPDGLMGRCT